MDHKAFVFDYAGFAQELEPSLAQALGADQVETLIKFIEAHRDSLKDPYEGNPLDDSWDELVEPKDVQQYGDFALTKYYDPGEPIGLSHTWLKISEALEEYLQDPLAILLGEPLRCGDAEFNPGLQGSYFQTDEQVRQNLATLNELLARIPNLAGSIGRLKRMFDVATEARKGLYVTF